MEINVQREIYDKLKEAKEISTNYADQSYIMCKEVHDLSKKYSLKQEEGYALIGLSFACRAKSDNQMLEYAYCALEIFENLKDAMGQIRALNLIGVAYFYNAVYEQAIKYFSQALNLFETAKDDFLLSCVLNNIGEVFLESMQYSKALEYFNRAMCICIQSNLTVNTASLYCNMGEVYFLLERYEEALEYYKESFKIHIHGKDWIALGEIENKLGSVHYVNGDHDKAFQYYKRALTRFESIENKFYAIDVLINLARYEFEIGKSDPSIYFDKAIRYAQLSKAKKKLSSVYHTMADYYEKIGAFEDALVYFKNYHLTEREISTSIIGNKFEILKIELGHMKDTQKLDDVKLLNHRLEMEIINQRSELDKIHKLNHDLEIKAFEDELTGIPNRRFINNELNKIQEEALDKDEVIALFMIDIDQFKKYNDYWGHNEGDQCLIKVADCLKKIQVSRKDILGRYGGEEFIYFARNINYPQAFELGNLLRIEIEKLSLGYMPDKGDSRLTISVGGVISKLSSIGQISDVIESADMELYKAKNMGRNLTIINNMLDE